MVSSIDHKAVAAILRGQGCANSLKALLESREISSVSVEPLINNILDCFSLALSFVDSPNPPPYHEPSFQDMVGHVPQISSKRKICGIEGITSHRDDSPTPRSDDGFTWRKYGKKPIKNSLHQRSYYRCTYAKDHNCNATKRVQMIKDSPPIYRTTYVGKHSCAVHDDTYGSEMIQFDQVVSESVMPTIDHQAITMEDKATDHTMNQECDINDFLVDYDHFLANQFSPFLWEDPMVFDNIAAFN